MERDKEQDLAGVELGYEGGKLRLFVEAALNAGATVIPDEGQTHYLLHVMRAKEADRVLLFNGTDGEWRARVSMPSRRRCTLMIESQTQPQADVPDLWFAFAPIKKTAADYLAQKATELGARVLQPVITHRTIARRINLERLRANAIEAAEQSDRLTVPEIREPLGLDAMLRTWPVNRLLLFCDEAGDAKPIGHALSGKEETRPWGIITGPEGGFDAEERRALRTCAFVLPVTLGPRILRADTAALAALAVWQSFLGDWTR